MERQETTPFLRQGVPPTLLAGLPRWRFGLVSSKCRNRRTTPPRTAELPHLATFVRAAELGSFTAAAAELGLTQAAVSGRIRSLEHELGVSLFDRQAARVRLTDAGRQLFDYAGRILALHEEARREIAGQHAAGTVDLVIAASSVPGEYLLPALLPGFRQEYPQIHVRASVTDSADVLRGIAEGRVTLGLVGRPPDDTHYESRALAGDRLVVVVPPAHEWAERDEVSLDDFCAAPLVLREIGSGSRWCLERALARAGRSLKELDVALELGSNAGIKEAVLRGMGVAVLSDRVVRGELEEGRLHAVSVIGLDLRRRFFICWDGRRGLPRPARALVEYLEMHAAALGP